MLEIVAVLGVIVVGLATAWVARLSRGRARRLENFAAEVGLAYDDSGPYGTAYGEVHEFDYEVTIQPAKLSDYNQHSLARYMLICRADLRRLLPGDLSISQQRFLDDWVDNTVDRTDVEIGDDDFDQTFLVDADDPDRARELLRRGRAADALTGLVKSETYVQIRDGRLEMFVESMPTSADEIRRWSDRFARYVDRFSDALQRSPEEDAAPQGW